MRSGLIRTGTAATLLLVPLSVHGADFQVTKKAAPPPYNWTGPYAGVNGGYAGGQSQFRSEVLAGGSSLNTFTSEPTLEGYFGGVQIGYNWQGLNPYTLVGFETDFQGASQNATVTQDIPTIAGGASLSDEFRVKWFGTARARFAWVLNETNLLYATGGYAYAMIDVDSTGTVAGFTGTNSQSVFRSGWTAGGGVEARLWGNWTGKVEYLYLDFGSVHTSYNLTAGGVVGFVATTDADIRNHVIRAGFNRRF
jgi:outer membrane immunogenic protein